MDGRRHRPLGIVIRVAAGAGGVLLGGVLVPLGVFVGPCDAFGGACPSPDGLQGDVYGTIGSGLALAVAAPILAWRPDRRGVLLALAISLPVAAAGASLLGRSVVT